MSREIFRFSEVFLFRAGRLATALIEYHRSLRSKEQVKSILDDIPGIGEKRRKALMKHFASIEAIKNAAIDELAQVESMNEKAAASVYKFFHQGGAKE